MIDGLKKSILKTLAYFDIFNHPLTKEELFRYLLITDNSDLRIKYTDFIKQLDGLPGEVRPWRTKSGFYFLPGQEKNVATRQARVKISEQKMKIAVRGIKKIAWVPFVRAVFVCNTIAMGVAEENSDIDVFIIVKKNRIFLARALATLILSLFRIRRTKNKINNRICLSFYVADDQLNLEKVGIKDDVYLIYWLNNLIPVYDPEGLHKSVVKANKWVERYLINSLQLFVTSRQWKVDNGKVGKFFKKILEKVWGAKYGDLIEAQAKGAQLAKMKMNYNSAQNIPDTRVIVSDSMLKFHENDRREEYREKWLEKCREISNSPNF
ncbi:MAG: hypothetical protein US42_C0003G0031 [Candidatus Magasanikbacteria bacterium GW2011_GWC2_37_14]|uniref:Polymerase nucleotidyl transferase domain-containing protein n=1 Tax=Candidatus Magasanikbacteria bacterium GW2011_GWC2_37_14 TaxID=1619046 RepID=A0A0G0IUX9_9BACT|nr:MAG: hypothetical protein US42_C0003G0031 [Candidatus Magasanikbacteria bacterium GW2011_GWC2_37_14]